MIGEQLQAAQLYGLKGLVEEAKLPTFAAWRWSKLQKCLRHLASFVWLLAPYFDVLWFATAKDKERLRQVVSALRDEAWYWQYQVWQWFSDWMGDLLEWAGSCPCHQERWANREPNDCERKGRLLGLAYGKACGRLDSGSVNSSHVWRK